MTTTTQQIIRMNSVVLWADTMLRRVPDRSARLSATRALELCCAFCLENQIPLTTRVELSRTLVALGYERIKSNGRYYYCCIAYRSDPRYRAVVSNPQWRLMQLMQSVNTTKTMTITEFCTVYGLSRNTFYKMKKIGRAPEMIKVGSVTRIHHDAAEQWALRAERVPIDLRW